jgi:nucleotide-binding universal stress UspA family protein
MFMNAIVAVGDRPGARDAIALALDLIDEQGALGLAHLEVADAPPRPASPTPPAGPRSSDFDGLGNARWGTSPAVPTDSGLGLHELAEREGCDLLVVVASRRSALTRVLLGDHDRRPTLEGMPCAVAVAPSGYAGRAAALREIGVGYDGSRESRHALACARRLAAAVGARVSACAALPGPGPGGRPGADPPTCAAHAAGLLTSSPEHLGALGGIESRAAYGPAVRELVRYSARVDLLVIGSGGGGPSGRIVHGRTSRELSRRARSALLMLPRPPDVDPSTEPPPK